MDITKRKIRMFAILNKDGEEYPMILGEFDSMEDIRISPTVFSDGTIIEFEEYFIGGEE